MTGHSHLLRRSRSSEPRGSAPLWAEGAARDPDQPFPRPRLEGAAGPQAQHALGPAGAAAAPARYGSPSGPSGGRRAHLPAEPGPARPGPARPGPAAASSHGIPEARGQPPALTLRALRGYGRDGAEPPGPAQDSPEVPPLRGQ